MGRPSDALDECGAVWAEFARDQDIPLIYTHPCGAPHVRAGLTTFDEDLSGPVLWSRALATCSTSSTSRR